MTEVNIKCQKKDLYSILFYKIIINFFINIFFFTFHNIFFCNTPTYGRSKVIKQHLHNGIRFQKIDPFFLFNLTR